MSLNSKAQQDAMSISFQEFLEAYNSGDLITSNNILHKIIDSKLYTNEFYKGLMYNNLCGINTLLGRYDSALVFSQKAEKILILIPNKTRDIADIYINRASIYSIQKSYSAAIDYIEKAIRIYNDKTIDKDKKVLQEFVRSLSKPGNCVLSIIRL